MSALAWWATALVYGVAGLINTILIAKWCLQILRGADLDAAAALIVLSVMLYFVTALAGSVVLALMQ